MRRRGKAFSLPLNRRHPLWEEWLLDGLEGGRWAILSKVHHCMVDGAGGNDPMALIFDTVPDEHPPAAIPWVPAPRPSLAGQAARDLRDAVTRPFRRLASAPGLLRRVAAEDLCESVKNCGSPPRAAEPPAAVTPIAAAANIRPQGAGDGRDCQGSSGQRTWPPGPAPALPIPIDHT